MRKVTNQRWYRTKNNKDTFHLDNEIQILQDFRTHLQNVLIGCYNAKSIPKLLKQEGGTNHVAKPVLKKEGRTYSVTSPMTQSIISPVTNSNPVAKPTNHVAKPTPTNYDSKSPIHTPNLLNTSHNQVLNQEGGANNLSKSSIPSPKLLNTSHNQVLQQEGCCNPIAKPITNAQFAHSQPANYVTCLVASSDSSHDSHTSPATKPDTQPVLKQDGGTQFDIKHKLKQDDVTKSAITPITTLVAKPIHMPKIQEHEGGAKLFKQQTTLSMGLPA